MMRIKKNDTVMVIGGKERGRQGVVLEVMPAHNLVLVQGINVVTRHVKPRRQGEQGSIRKEEKAVLGDKVMPVCVSCKKPCRVRQMVAHDKRVRSCHRCKEVLP